MNNQEIKAGLEQLTKEEIIKTFSSLSLKQADKKNVIIEEILENDPSDAEIANFKEQLSAKLEEAKKAAPPAYIVVSPIKEDGERYKRGSEYDGKFAERFLKEGQIRKKG